MLQLLEFRTVTHAARKRRLDGIYLHNTGRYSDIHSSLLHLSWTEVYMFSPTDQVTASPAWLFCSLPSPFPGQFVSTLQ